MIADHYATQGLQFSAPLKINGVLPEERASLLQCFLSAAPGLCFGTYLLAGNQSFFFRGLQALHVLSEKHECQLLNLKLCLTNKVMAYAFSYATGSFV